MPLRETFPKSYLPATHYFITIARGPRTRTLALPVLALRAALGCAGMMTAWCLAATLYLVFHDDLMAGLMAHETAMQYAYEERLANLRQQLESASSQALLEQREFEGKMQTLQSREAQLAARASIIESFADEAGLARRAPSGATGHLAACTAPTAALPADAEQFAPREPSMLDKPHPEGEDGRVLPLGEDHAYLPSPFVPGEPAASRLSFLTRRLDQVEAQELQSLVQIGRSARQRVTKFDSALETAGLSLDRFAGHPSKGAVGGPFVPIDLGPPDSPFEHAASGLTETLAEADRIGRILPAVPLRRPYTEAAGLSSVFGPRSDPFTGKPAMHTGVDFVMEMGAPVHATAAGKVTVAGPEGGYGNMVEIDHGFGLATRYAHLSSIAVAVGQKIRIGDVVGNVGATGRATGPHLHYETRIDGEAVDPLRFLRAGQLFFAAAR
jgi:murein DD-endopeptidase MepM/ murein hydrolase activator NlpD